MTSSAHDLTRWLAEIRERLELIEQQIVIANDVSGETLDEWTPRWQEDRRRRGIGDDRGRWRAAGPSFWLVISLVS